MRKLNEVLRLRFELGLGQRAIARACSISQGAVHNYLKKAAAAGFGWPLPEGWDEKRIEEALFGNRRPIERRPRALPGLPALREQLQKRAVGPRTKLGLLTRTGVAGPAAIGSGATQGWG